MNVRTAVTVGRVSLLISALATSVASFASEASGQHAPVQPAEQPERVQRLSQAKSSGQEPRITRFRPRGTEEANVALVGHEELCSSVGCTSAVGSNKSSGRCNCQRRRCCRTCCCRKLGGRGIIRRLLFLRGGCCRGRGLFCRGRCFGLVSRCMCGWRNQPPGDMVGHMPYETWRMYYYLRPYQASHVDRDRTEFVSWLMYESQPYANDMFYDLHRSVAGTLPGRGTSLEFADSTVGGSVNGKRWIDDMETLHPSYMPHDETTPGIRDPAFPPYDELPPGQAH